jgi:hypothetical protein
MLETIRQFAEEQLVASGILTKCGIATPTTLPTAVIYRDIWEGPRQRAAIDWVDVAQPAAGFRWSMTRSDLVIAGDCGPDGHHGVRPPALSRPVGRGDPPGRDGR